MAGDNKFGLISVAYRSRFLFRMEKEYCDTLGVSYETVMNNRDSEREMEMYYGILARTASKRFDMSLEYIIDNYVVASEAYLTQDWGDRSHIASRRKFCRMMYRIAATAGRGFTSEERFKFKIKDADEELLGLFFPNGFEAPPAVEIGFMVLFAFGIIRPWSGDSFRGRDIRDKETLESLRKLKDLILLLKEDTPRLGSLEKPLVFDQWLDSIDSYMQHPERLRECTPMMMVAALMDIARACRSLVVSEEQRAEGERYHGLYMHGIWVDDADAGQTRFWIFPDNLLAAFCTRREGIAWALDVYDFRVTDAYNPAYRDSFIMLAPRGNLNFTLFPHNIIADDQMVSGYFEQEHDEATGEIIKVNIYDGPRKLPEWLNWHSWQRLSPEDSRYQEFRAVLSAVYDLHSPHSIIFRNTAPELSDVVNNLVGHDKKYLYIYDWHPKRFVVKEKKPYRFTYEGEPERYLTDQALFELNITDKNPLYAVPKDVERKNYGDVELNRVVEVLTDAENIVEAYIIHSEHIHFPRLVFPAYGVSIDLNMEVLSKIGVKKFTSRPF